MPPLKALLRTSAHNAAGAALETLVRLAALGSSAGPPTASPGSIFVLRNNDVGDVLVITPLFEALRRRFPDARIAAGVGSWSLDVLRHNPHLSEVLTVEAPWFNKYSAGGPADRLLYLSRSPQVRAVRERRFEAGIDVLGSAWGSLLLLRAGIPWRLGVRGYAGGHSAAQATIRFDPCEHVGRTALRFAEALGATDLPANRPQLFLTPEEAEEAERLWAAAEGGRRRRRIVVGPGGGLAVKCWPVESFAGLVTRLPELGHDLSVLVLGGPRETAIVDRVAAASPQAWSPAEVPGLRQAFALVAAADLVVCNSSMLLHTAAAFARPTVAVLGESFPSAAQHQAQWGYPGICRSLGKEPGERERLYTPAETLAVLQEETRTWS